VYRFCNNNALNRIDPTGLYVERAIDFDPGLQGPGRDSANRMAENNRSELAKQAFAALAKVRLTMAPISENSAYSTAADIVSRINPQSIKDNREKIFIVYLDPKTGEIKATNVVTTTETGLAATFRVPHGALPLVIAHTHGDYSTGPPNAIVRTDKAHDTYHSDTFSNGSQRSDIPLLRSFQSNHPSLLGGVLGTPSGHILQYDIKSDKISDITPR
jgi:Domain of unknown function (DUF4329)